MGWFFAGIPLTVHSSGGRSTSRASSQRTFVSTYSRRVSSAQGYHQGSRGVLVSASRAGAARAAAILLISCHVTHDDSPRMAGAQSPEESMPGTVAGDTSVIVCGLCVGVPASLLVACVYISSCQTQEGCLTVRLCTFPLVVCSLCFICTHPTTFTSKRSDSQKKTISLYL